MTFSTSCRTISRYRDLQGNYYKAGKGYQYSLTLNIDSSFTLTEKYFEVNSTCNGKWQRLRKDTLLLKCNETDVYSKLQSGYMTERERKVVLLRNRKAIIGNATLKRRN